MTDSAQMNMWLHKTVLQKIAENEVDFQHAYKYRINVCCSSGGRERSASCEKARCSSLSTNRAELVFPVPGPPKTKRLRGLLPSHAGRSAEAIAETSLSLPGSCSGRYSGDNAASLRKIPSGMKGFRHVFKKTSA
jgi:hypothetical protein